ncbi:hypothetical protein ACQKJC_24660 [Priestia koreensis]|uniref:hypothetical protein n=1 Tax=Priestia koreensis TaxID=284581 RepID=UPI003D07BA32
MVDHFVVALAALQLGFEVFKYFNDKKPLKDPIIQNEKKSPERDSGDLKTKNK